MKKKSTSRREWIKNFSLTTSVFGLLGLSIYKRATLAQFFRKINPTIVDIEPIPNESEYREFLSSLDLQYFNPEEFIRPHRNLKHGVRNSIPPKSLWPNIIPTLHVANMMRERLGVSGHVLSIYRSPEYNTAINGASRSQHMSNRAIDLKFDCSSDEAFELAKKLREEGVFNGGIGWYPSFIHIDTRGYEATWGKEV